jgi:hypothetical protein
MELKSVPLKEGEINSKPSAGLGALGILVSDIRSSSGRHFDFPAPCAALQVRTVGPFGNLSILQNKTDASLQSARILVSQDYLSMGLARLCELETSLKNQEKEDPAIGLKLVGNFSKTDIDYTLARMQKAEFTAEDEKLYVYSNMSVLQFSSIAQQTPGVKDILSYISDRPGILSAGNLFLDWKNCTPVPASSWPDIDAKVFRIPFVYTLKKTEVKGTFFVTDPSSPLQTVGGILAITCTSSKATGITLSTRLIGGVQAPINTQSN